VLRRQIVPHLSPIAQASAEELWLRIQVLMTETAERLSAYRNLVAAKRDQIVREVGQRLITAPDLEQQADGLAEELPKIGIPRCYLALYVNADEREAGGLPDRRGQQGGHGARSWSRALLVYEDGARRHLERGEAVFRSRDLVPGKRLRREAPYSLVALPLHFKTKQLGFVLMEVGPRIGWIYEALQEQLGSALEAALLVEREKRTLAAIEKAREELEERVAARTAELAEANAILTEQMIERERAEETRAGLEAQLRHAQKMEALGRLAGGVAHDFNNLLVVINGYTDLLLSDLREDNPMRGDLQQVRQAGERAAMLTRQLLAFGRKQVLQPTVLSLNRIVSDVETMLQRLIGEDVELATQLDPNLGRILADPGQIEQVIVNLAVNARDAMPQGGRMTIETANVYLDDEYARQRVGVIPGHYVMLRVSDTGVGIDAAIRARLFEPFFTTKPQGEGTGLGLATVFGIVQASGGHIAVSSAPGEGATFTVYLPQSVQIPAEGDASGLRPEAPKPGSETILLVEDDADVRRVIRRFLQERGYRVLEASRASEALDLFQQHDGTVDLVITDVVMPGTSGRELVERLTSIRPEIRVLYVSGYAEDAAVRQGLSDASIVLLEKPFTAQALSSKVRELLDLAQAG
jgi:signal transduction histidine kinase/CheY-like chemotaxis protein